MKLQVGLPDNSILDVQLNATETRRIINSEKISKWAQVLTIKVRFVGITGNLAVGFLEILKSPILKLEMLAIKICSIVGQ